MNVFHKISVVAVATSGACIFSGWWWRPQADNNDNDNPQMKRIGNISKISLTDQADQSHPWLYQISSQAVILTTSIVARCFLFGAGECKIKRDESYNEFLKHVCGRNKGIPLITISNHRSMVDDPSIMSGILPFWLAIQPKYNRCGFCSQEYCFNSKVRL